MTFDEPNTNLAAGTCRACRRLRLQKRRTSGAGLCPRGRL